MENKIKGTTWKQFPALSAAEWSKRRSTLISRLLMKISCCCGKCLLTLSACWAVQIDTVCSLSARIDLRSSANVTWVPSPVLPSQLWTNSSNQKMCQHMATRCRAHYSPFSPSLPMPCESPTAAQWLAVHRGLWISIGKLPWFSAKCFRIERTAARWAANSRDNVVLNKHHLNGSFYVDSGL